MVPPLITRSNLNSEVPDRPSESGRSRAGGACLATKRLFEDPRHEQLGKELLEFNDDMSQSEILSDNDYAPMTPVRTRPITGNKIYLGTSPK